MAQYETVVQDSGSSDFRVFSPIDVGKTAQDCINAYKKRRAVWRRLQLAMQSLNYNNCSGEIESVKENGMIGLTNGQECANPGFLRVIYLNGAYECSDSVMDLQRGTVEILSRQITTSNNTIRGNGSFLVIGAVQPVTVLVNTVGMCSHSSACFAEFFCPWVC